MTIPASEALAKHERFTWRKVQCGRVTIAVACDALKVDGIRYGFSSEACQQLSDAMGCILPTAKIVDCIYNQADVKLTPHAQNVVDSNAERLHSAAIDRELAGRTGLVADVGKYWVLSKSAFNTHGMTPNYGWHTGVNMTIQGQPIGGVSLAHNRYHWDYSQTFRPVLNACMVGETPMRLSDLLMDPAFAAELSYEGPLPGNRLPGITPWPQCEFPMFEDAAEIPIPKIGDSPLVVEFIPARGFTSCIEPRDIKWVVLHSMETQKPEPTVGPARAVARWFGGPSAPQASAHYCVDAGTVIQGVWEKDIAWHAPGANRHGIGIEMSGQALHTDWGKKGGSEEKQWVLVTKLVADICSRQHIPIKYVDEYDLLRGERGITTHDTVSRAYRLAKRGYVTNYSLDLFKQFIAGASNHGDPGGVDGKRWPMDAFIADCRAQLP